MGSQGPGRPYGPPPYGPPPYAPQYGYPPPQRQTEGTAITVLVLAIVSFFVFPVVPAIAALALCPSADRNIKSSGGTLTGEGLVTAARVISWVNIGLWSLVVVTLVTIAVIAAVAGRFDESSLVLSVFR